MTPSEFKSWFEGFTEFCDKVPTQKQWARIKERVAEIDGKPVTERIYVDRYLPYVTRPLYWQGPWPYYGAGGGLGGSCSGGTLSSMGQNYQTALCANPQSQSYNSTTAMNALGRAEAQAMTQ